MSTNRENVIWQSADGTWNRGFYDFYETGDNGDDDFDHEWDVDYTDSFWWVSTGHSSAESANDSWRGSNPGGHSIRTYSAETAHDNELLDDEAAKTYLAANGARDISLNRSATYTGPKKERKPKFIAADLYDARLEAERYVIQGYSNLPDERIPMWRDTLKNLDRSKLSKEENEELLNLKRQYVAGLEKLADSTRSSLRRSSGYDPTGFNRRAREGLEKLDKLIVNVKLSVEKDKAELESPMPKSSDPASVQNGTTSGKTSSTRYHINPETGRANICTATKKACPYGGADVHYDSKAEAKAGYEKRMGSGLKSLRK